MNKKLLSFLTFLSANLLSAQDASVSAPQMADSFRQDGKIYVVIAVLSLIFLAIVFFLIYLERKISKLEGKLKQHSQTDVQK